MQFKLFMRSRYIKALRRTFIEGSLYFLLLFLVHAYIQFKSKPSLQITDSAVIQNCDIIEKHSTFHILLSIRGHRIFCEIKETDKSRIKKHFL